MASPAFAVIACVLNLAFVAWLCRRQVRTQEAGRGAVATFRAVFRLRWNALSNRDLPTDAWGRQVAGLRLQAVLSNMVSVWGAILSFILFDVRPR